MESVSSNDKKKKQSSKSKKSGVDQTVAAENLEVLNKKVEEVSKNIEVLTETKSKTKKAKKEPLVEIKVEPEPEPEPDVAAAPELVTDDVGESESKSQDGDVDEASFDKSADLLLQKCTHVKQAMKDIIKLAKDIKRDYNKLKKSINVFTKAINLDPYWAEAWNKRATAYYMIGEFQKSQDDIDKVLELENRHFGALAGQGMVNIQLKNYDKAKLSYQKAQEIYPAMKSSKVMIKQIEELIKRQSI